MKLTILVGTMSSTANSVAQAVQLACSDLVGDIEVTLMDDLDIGIFEAGKVANTLYLICSSTYGSGDVPDNARTLFESLSAQPQYLGHVRYGVMALGDSCYPQTFCFGGKQFDTALQDLGGQRLGEIWCHDASSGIPPETDGAAWGHLWLSSALQTVSVSSAAA